jgi:hypothetical protein
LSCAQAQLFLLDLCQNAESLLPLLGLVRVAGGEILKVDMETRTCTGWSSSYLDVKNK